MQTPVRLWVRYRTDRKDGSKAFTAQIVIKKAGVIVHREAETFDRKQAANAWIVKREAELELREAWNARKTLPCQLR